MFGKQSKNALAASGTWFALLSTWSCDVRGRAYCGSPSLALLGRKDSRRTDTGGWWPLLAGSQHDGHAEVTATRAHSAAELSDLHVSSLHDPPRKQEEGQIPGETELSSELSNHKYEL